MAPRRRSDVAILAMASGYLHKRAQKLEGEIRLASADAEDVQPMHSLRPGRERHDFLKAVGRRPADGEGGEVKALHVALRLDLPHRGVEVTVRNQLCEANAGCIFVGEEESPVLREARHQPAFLDAD